MKARDWFILIFTFVVAFFCGMYLYVTNFKPNYDATDVPDAAVTGDLGVIGVRYGEAGASFRVREDGSYDYIAAGESAERASGELPGDLERALARAVAAADLAALAEPSGRTDCVESTTDVEYNIEYQAVDYSLDTCTTVFSHATPLGEVLLEIWKFVENPDAFTLSISNSPGGLDTPDSEAAEEYGSSWTLRGYFERGFKDTGFRE